MSNYVEHCRGAGIKLIGKDNEEIKGDKWKRRAEKEMKKQYYFTFTQYCLLFRQSECGSQPVISTYSLPIPLSLPRFASSPISLRLIMFPLFQGTSNQHICVSLCLLCCISFLPAHILFHLHINSPHKLALMQKLNLFLLFFLKKKSCFLFIKLFLQLSRFPATCFLSEDKIFIILHFLFSEREGHRFLRERGVYLLKKEKLDLGS